MLKRQKSHKFPTHSHLKPPVWGIPSNFADELRIKNQTMGLSDVEDP